MLTFFLAYLFCGMLMGLLAGVFGIGGGVIGIPFLFFLFDQQNFPSDISMHMAIGTIFATVIVTGLVAIYTHHRRKMILYPVFKKIIFGSMLGSLIGILIAQYTYGVILQYIFGLFLLLIAVQLFFDFKFTLAHLEKPIKLFSVSLGIGIFSSLLGLGGGVLIVPYLNACGIPLRNAIATATACIVPSATIGTIGYMLATNKALMPAATHSGYIYWPAFFGISLMTVLTTPLGVALSHKIPVSLLKKFFALLLLVIGSLMLLS